MLAFFKKVFLNKVLFFIKIIMLLFYLIHKIKLKKVYSLKLILISIKIKIKLWLHFKENFKNINLVMEKCILVMGANNKFDKIFILL